MPLSAAVWSQTAFHRPVASADLFAAVLSDQSAALLAYGLAALDDETLRFLVEHPAVITRLYERDAAASRRSPNTCTFTTIELSCLAATRRFRCGRPCSTRNHRPRALRA